MGTNKIGVPGYFFNAEATHTEGEGGVVSIAIAGTMATVTQTAHGYTTGQLVTFSGVTGVTGLNGAHWQITVTGVNTYTFTTTLAGVPAGTILAQPVTVLSYGTHYAALGANVLIEYNPDNMADFQQGIGVVGATWRLLIPANASGTVFTDGNAVRVRAIGVGATSYISKVN